MLWLLSTVVGAINSFCTTELPASTLSANSVVASVKLSLSSEAVSTSTVIAFFIISVVGFSTLLSPASILEGSGTAEETAALPSFDSS